MLFGCLTNNKLPQIVQDTKLLFSNLGLDIQYFDKNEVPCCGSICYHGYIEIAKKTAIQLKDFLEKNQVTELITGCAGCYYYLTTEFEKQGILLNGIKIQHITQKVHEIVKSKQLKLKYTADKKLVITYHDPCHLRNAKTPVLEEPREILNSIENITFKELSRNKMNSQCCGAGAGIYASIPEISNYNAQLIIDNARSRLAKVLVTPCSFCFYNLTRIDTKIKIMKFESFIKTILEGGKILD
jgi:Fe-S oxidoreductase